MTEPVFTSAPVDRSGMNAYLHLVRALDDPERSPRAKADDPRRDTLSVWRRELKRSSVLEWRYRILDHLRDGVPRTFNRICVELLDKTADIIHQLPPDLAIWDLVAGAEIEHTIGIPIFFRIKEPTL